MFFIKLIYYIIYDFIHRKETKKDISGIYTYVGLFGQGKTLSMVRDLKLMKDKGYNIYTNIDVSFQDGRIVSWKDILNVPPNSVCAIDEISYIFNNKEWKNMPKEVFGYIVQQRKRNVRICCTAQSFEEIDKSIREKSKYVIDCKRYGRIIRNKYYTVKNFLRADSRRKKEFSYTFIREDKFADYYNTNEIVKMLKDTKCDNSTNIINNVINL